jgi:sugar lactone lactonase YvrE
MMYLEVPPRLIGTEVFSAMPDAFRRKGVRTDWADANRPGQPTDCFIEGPSFDADGNLYIVDIPFGRIFRIAPDGKWSLVTEYDGWPNGLKIRADGRVFVADYMHGIMELDLLTHRYVFVFAPNGEVIARIKSCAGPSCTNVAIGGKERDRLYITESVTGTVLSADIGVLDSSLRGA